MDGVAIIGVIVGLLLGIIHAAYIFIRGWRVDNSQSQESRPPLYLYAAWAIVLWTLLGGIVLLIWCIALLFFIPARIAKRPSTILPWLTQSSKDRPAPLADGTSQGDPNFRLVRRVAIIGAGISGLAAARVLISQGIECVLFERRASLGGVWADGYMNFGVQVPRNFYEFPDWPLPLDTPEFTPGPIVQDYLEGYARNFNILSHIRFRTEVVSVAEASTPNAGWILTYNSPLGEKSDNFDFVVVSVGLYSETPHIPKFNGLANFQGDVIHVSSLKSPEQIAGKNVVVVGYGKSATDAALESVKYARKTSLVFRRAHWPIPRKLVGLLPFTYGMFHRLVSTLIPAYVYPTPLERAVHTVGRPLPWLWWRLVELLLRFQCKLGSKFGNRIDLISDDPIEIGGFGEPTMVPRPGFFEAIHNGAIQAHRTDIDNITSLGVHLKSGDKIAADVLLLGTGWQTDYAFFSPSVRERLGFDRDGLYLYKHMLHPDVPHMAFVGHASTNSCILTSSIQACWLGSLLSGQFALPGKLEMRQEISTLKDWKRSWLPDSEQRGARIMLHMLHYHDELLTDMGINPLRKTGFFAPIKEVFDPYLPRDYRNIAARIFERPDSMETRKKKAR